MSQISAEKPVLAGGIQYHLRLKPGDVARYVLLPGDPARVAYIARFWDEARIVASHREYVTYTGRYRGVPISATSTGIGGPSTAIAIEELLRVGADTFIRVGTTASLTKAIPIGSIIISYAALRMDGTSKAYAPEYYPAVSSLDVLLALAIAAELQGFKYFIGLTASTDSFYVGQERPGFKDYLPPWNQGLIALLRSLNIINFEMEASTIFTLSQIYGARAGSVCAVVANRETNEFVVDAGLESAIKTACEAVRILYEWDELRTKYGLSLIQAVINWIKR